MSNIFLAADMHFGHKGMTTFLREDGSPQRAWATTEEMDEALVSNWNSAVGPNDKVYVLGDCVINRRCLPTLGRLNGLHTLVMGNHDVFRPEEYLQYFKCIKGSEQVADFLLTHIPVHAAELKRWKGNFHGHLHHNRVRKEVLDGRTRTRYEVVDAQYFCVSMENIGYIPIILEDAIKKFEEQQ